MKKLFIGLLSVVFATTCFGAGINVDRDTVLAVKGTGNEGATNIIDFGATGHIVTQVGTAQLSTSQKVFGSTSGLLDGNSDYWQLADSADWDLDKANWTMEGWFRIASGTGDVNFAGQYEDGNNHWMWWYDDAPTPMIVFFIWGGGGASYKGFYSAETGGSIADSNWHHVVVERDDNENPKCLMFLDGTKLSVTQTIAFASYTDYTGVLNIGYGVNGGYFDGYIDEFRISDNTRWTTAFTPETAQYTSDANTLLLLHMGTHDISGECPYNTSKVATFNGTAQIKAGSPYSYIVDPDNLVAHYKMDDNAASTTWADSSGNGYDATGSANTSTYDAASPIGLGGFYLNAGYNGSVADTADLNLDGDDWTVSVWAKLDVININQTILAKGAYLTDGYFIFFSDSGNLLVYTNQSGVAQASSIGTGKYSAGVWYMWTFVKDGSTVSIYQNGVDISGTQNSHTNCATSTGDAMKIGSNSDGSGKIDGTLDELQIYSSALTAAQVAELYQNSCSLYGGTTSGIEYADSTEFDLIENYTDDYCVGFWAKMISPASWEIMLTQGESQDDKWEMGHYAANGWYFKARTGASFVIDCDYASPTTDSKWHWFVMQKKGGASAAEYGVYLDGNQIQYVSDSSVDTYASNLFVGTGWNETTGINGYMSDLFFVKGNPFGANPNSGETDTIAVPDSPLSYTAKATSLTYDTNAQLYVVGDGNAGAMEVRDDSPSGKIITEVGSSAIGTTTTKIGSGAGVFDGTSNCRMTSPYSSDFIFGDTYTVEFWIYRDGSQDQYDYVVGLWDNAKMSWLITFNASEGLQLGYNGANHGCVATGATTNQTFHHVAVVREDATTTKIYLDGVQAGSTYTTDYTIATNTSLLTIGGYTGSGYEMDCIIDELRISNIARYTENFTPSTTEFVSDDNTLLLTHFDTHDISDNNFVSSFVGTAALAKGAPVSYVVDPDNLVAHYRLDDDAPSTRVIDEVAGVNATLVGGDNTDDKAEIGAVNKGQHLDGAADYIQAPSTLVTALSDNTTGTVNAWIYIDSDDAAQHGIFSCFPTSSATNTFLQFYFDLSSDYLAASCYADGTAQWAWTGLADQTDALIGTWAMVTAVHDGTSAEFYINGVNVTDGGTWGTDTDKTDWWKSVYADATTDADNLIFGGKNKNGTASQFLDGLNDDIQIYDTALTAAQVLELYQNAMGVEFDGDSDYILYADNAAWDLCADVSSTYTISMYIKCTDHAGQEHLIAQCNSAGTEYWKFQHTHGSGFNFLLRDGSSVIVSTTAGGEITDTEWHHVVLLVEGDTSTNTYSVYVDGNQVTYDQDSSTHDLSQPLYLGMIQVTKEYFDGQMHQVFLYEGDFYGLNPNSDCTDTFDVPDFQLTAEEVAPPAGGSGQVIILC